MLSKEQAIKEYNSTRTKEARSALCHAPFSSINFTQSGDMLACCYNRRDILGTYPKQSIKDAWEGETAEKLRVYMRGAQLGGGCENCQEQIFSGNYAGSKAALYDEFAPQEKQSFFNKLLAGRPKLAPPKLFEFEISNICNLECTMCNGLFSSAIRANREKLPKLHSPYDEHFVAQVKEYLPYLEEAKFLGGEPFMISQYLEIWEAIIAINPNIKVHITTNGTVLNKRAKDSLEKMKAGIIISVDSLDKENYEQIRVNGDFQELMENIRWFIDYRNRKGLYLTFAVCPMISNRKHLAEIIRFCNDHAIYIHFNTVWKPKEECLRYAAKTDLQALIHDLLQIEFSNEPIQQTNAERTGGLIAHLKAWESEQESDKEKMTRLLNTLNNSEKQTLSPNADIVLNEIVQHYNLWLREDELPIRLGSRLEKIAEKIGHDSFRLAFAECLLYSAKKTLPTADWESISLKVQELSFVPPDMTAETLNKSLMRNFDFITILGSLQETSYEKFKANVHHLRST